MKRTFGCLIIVTLEIVILAGLNACGTYGRKEPVLSPVIVVSPEADQKGSVTNR